MFPLPQFPFTILKICLSDESLKTLTRLHNWDKSDREARTSHPLPSYCYDFCLVELENVFVI